MTLEATLALGAYTALNITGPILAIHRMKKRQSSGDISIGWIVGVLGAVIIILIYSLTIGSSVFIYGQITAIMAQTSILTVIIYYRTRKPASNSIPEYVDHLTSSKFNDYIREQLRDMEQGERGGQYEAKEIADIIALSIQRLMEMGFEPSDVMLQRIQTRYVDKQTMLRIMGVYSKWWEKEFGEDSS